MCIKKQVNTAAETRYIRHKDCKCYDFAKRYIYDFPKIFTLKKRFPISVKNYFNALSAAKTLIKDGTMELFAGDCPIEEVEQHLKDEDLYTVILYLRCQKCNTYYWLGACVRGEPGIRIVRNVHKIPLNRVLTGRKGVFFENRDDTA